MNKYSILFLGALAGLMVGCDDKIPTAMPQENEQGPVLEGITGTTASPTSTMTAGIDLETLDPETTPTLSLYTLGAGDSGLEPSSLSGYMQISNTMSFGEYVELKPVDGVQGTVSTADLNEAYLQLFGRAPQTSTVYWRVPMYATLSGTTFHIGSLDYYGGEGTFMVTAPDPGFEILENYYLIGDMNGWTAQADNIAPYKFEHSDASIYDDPTFTYSFTAESSVYFKIVPGDVFDSMSAPGWEASDDTFWNLLIGVAVEDGATEGDLTDYEEIGAQPGALSVPAGTWTVTINMETWTYTITGKAAGGGGAAWALADLYFRGGFTDDWGAYPQYQFVLTSTDNTYLNPMVSLPAGINFKVADADWGSANYGVGSTDLAFGTPYEMVYNAGDIAIPGAFNGWTEIVTNSTIGATMTMNEFASATAGTATGIYLRGSFSDDWGAYPEYEFLTTEYEGVYELTGVSLAAGTNFKVADADWGSINYGATDGVDFTINAANTLSYNTGDINLADAFTGTIKIVTITGYDKYFLYFIPE